MAVLFTDSISTAGYKAFLSTVRNLTFLTKISMVSEISSLAYLARLTLKCLLLTVMLQVYSI